MVDVTMDCYTVEIRAFISFISASFGYNPMAIIFIVLE